MYIAYIINNSVACQFPFRMLVKFIFIIKKKIYKDDFYIIVNKILILHTAKFHQAVAKLSAEILSSQLLINGGQNFLPEVPPNFL